MTRTPPLDTGKTRRNKHDAAATRLPCRDPVRGASATAGGADEEGVLVRNVSPDPNGRGLGARLAGLETPVRW